MSTKVSRAIHGPSWAEVILGAVISLFLGVVLGAMLLVLRPPVVIKAAPKAEDRVRGAVYYIEGSRDTAKARDALSKRKAFAGGQSVTVIEEELNALAGGAPAAPGKEAEKSKTADKGKASDKGKDAAKTAPAAATGMFTLGPSNFRIQDGTLQVAVPVTVNTLDLGLKLIAQARGGIAKKGDTFAFEATELYLGSCPVQRLPFLAGYLRDSFIAAQSLPDDVKGSWAKLASVTIEGNKLKLTMP